jgi:hypothetical protein
MSKRVANIMEAQLPTPPVLETFVRAIEDWDERRRTPAVDADPVHGTSLGDVVSATTGTQ